MGKRLLINEKVRKVVLTIAIFSTMIVGVLSLIFMYNIKARLEFALVDQMENSMNNIIDSNANIANLKLSKYITYLENCQDEINILYKDSEDFKHKIIPNFSDTNFDKDYTLQRALASKNINVKEIEDELSLFSNLEYFLHPILKQDGNTITSIYMGHEKGFTLTYDNLYDKATPDDDGEVYFNFFERPWYKDTINSNKIIFSDLQQDYFGRGLTLTCSAPFKKNGKSVGVIAMDILVTDLQKEVIDVNIGAGAYSFITDMKGNIVASPFVKLETKEFDNIFDKNNIFNDVSNDIMNNSHGVTISNSGYYVAYKKIDIANWMLCMAVPKDLVLKSINEIDRSILFVLLAFLLILLVICLAVIIVARVFSNRLVKPIVKLKKDVELIAAGDFDKKAEEIGNDEITDLAKSFNDMTDSLKKYISDLTNVTKEKERIGAELNVATEIQASMLPNQFPAFPNVKSFDIYASMTPAKEVGGDFYDFFMIDNKHLAIVVADVSGKGVPAALFMVIGKTLIKDHTSLNSDLGSVFTNVNNLLCEANHAGLFITAFEAVIDLSTGEVNYVNAGHEMPFIYKKDIGYKPFNMKAAFVLAGMEDMNYKSGSFKLEPGDKIFQYTDGVTEATNVRNELYGMERLEKALNENHYRNSKELITAIKIDIDKFVDVAPQFDDITMLAFDFKEYYNA